jgi:hypothetical protein
MSHLRRTVERQETGTEPSLLRLRRFLFWIFMAASGLAVVSAVLSHMLLAAYISDIASVGESGQCMLDSQRISLNTAHRALESMGIESFTDDEYTALMQQSLDSATEFAALHSRLYLSTSETPLLRQLYVEPSLDMPVWDVHPPQQRMVGLLDAGTEFVSRVHLTLGVNRTSYAESLGAVQYILQNAPAALMDGLNQSAMATESTTSDGFQLTNLVLAFMMYGAAFFVVILDLFMIVPTLVRIESQKDGVWRVFLDVPQLVLRSMRSKCEKQLLVIQTEITESEDVDDDGGSEIGDVEGDFDEGLDGIDWSKAQLNRRHRHLTKSWDVFIKLLASFLLPTTLVLVYFAGVYFWSTAVSDTAKTNGRGVLFSVQREAKAYQVLFHAVNAMSNLTHSDYVAEAGTVMDLTRDLLLFEEVLLYGSSALNTPAGLQEVPNMAALFLEDGCTYTNVDHDDALVPSDWQERCLTFDNGLVASGLHGAVQEYAATTVTLMSELLSGTLAAGAQARFADHRIEKLEELMQVFMTQGLRTATRMFERQMRGGIDNFLLWHLLLTIAVCSSLAFCYLSVYRRNISKLDQEVKRTRAMLLFFPEEVIRGVASIRNMIDTLGGIGRRAG